MTILWNDSLVIGDADIDSQHEHLVGMVNRLLGSNGDDELVRITALYQYAREHFDYEERLMRRASYPEMSAHIAQHNFLISEIDAVRLKIAEGTFNRQNLESFLLDWLVDHIKNSDQKLAAFLPETRETQRGLTL